MILLLLASLAFAGEVQAVPEGTSIEVQGPAVFMTEHRFDRFLVAEQNLHSCEDALDQAVDEVVAANERVLHATEIAKSQFGLDEDTIATLVEQNRVLATDLDTTKTKLVRVQKQRDIALAVGITVAALVTAGVVATGIRAF